ncbi:hypothetical protein ACNAW0_00120 [Micromonospora sp. SL1-18]|uniref:hypothetical protein n=1 Tax=Micromonospora sp. SL1-18 TaxID=3399128 RepID=UPI003A4DFF79
MFAERINAAAVLAGSDVSTVEAAGVLAARFGVSIRQAYRYLRFARSGPVAVPEKTVVFTVKLPASLCTQVRAQARRRRSTISALVSEALTAYLHDPRGRRRG